MNLDTESSSMFKRLIGNSKTEECFKFMRESSKVEHGWCQPMEVLGTYFADVFIDANARIVQSSLDKYLELINDRGYFQGILITVLFAYIGFGLLKDVIVTTLGSVIRYGVFGARAKPPPPVAPSSSGIEEIREVLKETALQNQQLVTTFLEASRRNEARNQILETGESNEELPESMTRRSSDTESIEVIPESLAGDDEEDFEVVKE